MSARKLFEAAVIRNLRFWLPAGDELQAAEIDAIETQHQNLLQAARFGLDLPAAHPTLVQLIGKLYEVLGSRLRYEASWLPIIITLHKRLEAPMRLQLTIPYAHLLRYNSQAAQAQQLLLASLAAVGVSQARFDLLWELSQCANDLNDLGNAVAYSCEAQQIAVRLGDARTLAKIQHGLGIWATRLGQFDEAEAYFREAYEIESDLGDQTRIVRVLLGWAYKYNMEGAPLKALRLYLKAQEQLKATTNRVDTIQVLLNLGAVYFELKEYVQAESLFNEALRLIPAKQGWQYSEAQAYTNLSAVYQANDRHAEAIDMLENAIALWRRLRNSLVLCRALLNSAESFSALSRFDEALDACLEASIWLELHPDEIWAQQMLAESAELVVRPIDKNR